jgi:hypothetical protein
VKKYDDVMTVNEIPADETVEMTATLHRAFRVAGCRPTCHACLKAIPTGSMFKLATIPERSTKKHDFVFLLSEDKPRTQHRFKCTCGEALYDETTDEQRLGLCPSCKVVWEKGKTKAYGRDHEWRNIKENNQGRSVEVMLCANHGPEDMPRTIRRRRTTDTEPWGCYRVDGQIVLTLED